MKTLARTLWETLKFEAVCKLLTICLVYPLLHGVYRIYAASEGLNFNSGVASAFSSPAGVVVLLVVAVLYKIAMLVLFFFLYFFNFSFLHAHVAGIWFLFLLGLALNVIVIAVILLALYAQKAMRRLCDGCLRLLARLRVVRRPETAQEKLDSWLASFHDCAGFMREHPWPVVKSFCIVLFQRVLYLLIPWCVYEAMGLSGVTVWQMMGLQLLLSVSVEMMPLPGAVGISESVSLVLYDAIFGAQFRYPAVILTRAISYYLPLLVSGAVTLGTLDGTNIEIAEQAGAENEYIFGARADEIARLQKDGYDPNAVLAAEPRAKRVVESLVDGTFSDGGTGMFRELYASLTEGASWHKPDHYFLMRDFIEYCDARLAVNRDYRDARAFAAKCVRNVANAGVFSSDRTILEYARDIWHV